MTPNPHNAASNELALPGRWATEIEPQLAAGEKIQAWLEIDLDARLQFANGLVLVTDRRLLADLPGNYLHWFARKGFPEGELGRLLELMREIDHNGLSDLLTPLRRR